jgi:hypothetical protein
MCSSYGKEGHVVQQRTVLVGSMCDQHPGSMVSRNNFEVYISQNDPNKRIDVIEVTDGKEKIGQDLLTQQISSFYRGHQSRSELQMQHEPVGKEDDKKSRTR